MFNIINTIKRKKILAASLVLAILLIAGGLMYQPANGPGSQKALACSDGSEGSLLKEASGALDPSDEEAMKKLGGVVETIENTPGYETDYNCLYPVVIHNLEVADNEKARAGYESMKKAHGEGQALADDYRYRISLEDIGKRLEHAESYQERLEENIIGI